MILDIIFKLKQYTEECDGFFKAVKGFNLETEYNKISREEKSLRFYNPNKTSECFDIYKNDLIFVEIKDSNNCLKALEQSYEHLKDLRCLCFKEEKIILLLILRGDFKIDKKEKTLITNILKLDSNTTVMITSITKHNFFGLNIKRPKVKLEDLNIDLILTNKKLTRINFY